MLYFAFPKSSGKYMTSRGVRETMKQCPWTVRLLSSKPRAQIVDVSFELSLYAEQLKGAIMNKKSTVLKREDED